jgi:hypothetical protein
MSFGRELWRTWRDRPRLNFYVNAITFTNVPHFGEMRQIRVMICNVGYRPIILVRFRAFGNTSSFCMGVHDEPASALGIDDQRFPAKIEAGECLKIHPLGVAAFERNQIDPNDPKVHFDPWRCFVVEDSFGRFYPIEVEDVKRELHIGGQWQRYRGLKALRKSMRTHFFLRRARRKMS